jgi:hypothetical protein
VTHGASSRKQRKYSESLLSERAASDPEFLRASNAQTLFIAPSFGECILGFASKDRFVASVDDIVICLFACFVRGAIQLFSGTVAAKIVKSTVGAFGLNMYF